MNQELRNCQNCKQEFRIEPEDFRFYEKIKVPPPTFCPRCRLIRRLAQRNERSLYKRKCDLCGNEIIAMYSPDKPFKVYCLTCYFSDKWDPMEYGRDYDFSRPFFEQYKELQIAIPHLSLLNENSVNSPWINYELDDKNCYLNFGGHKNEDSAYSQYLLKCQDTLDSYSVGSGQFVYETTLGEGLYRTLYSTLCFDCRDTYFSFDCRNCSNIFGCSGLRHKQYHIYNQPVSKEEFERFISENSLASYKKAGELKKKTAEFWKSQPQRAVFIDKSVNCTGNFIEESKNCFETYNAGESEDSKYILHCRKIKDAMDTTSVWWGELSYEFIAGSEQLYNMRFTSGAIRHCTDIEYSHWLTNSHDCFGCINLKDKSFCILNKQYSKDEYRNLHEQIIQNMGEVAYKDKTGKIYKYGEFFPYELSTFGYNETVANEYFPLDREEALRQGLSWSDYEADKNHQFSDYKVPDDIRDVKDDVLDKVLKCEISGKPYRIIPMELAFYRRFGLPIPRVAPFERHRGRLRFIADHLTLHDRTCEKCGKTTKSVYREEEFPHIYCEECYLREVV